MMNFVKRKKKELINEFAYWRNTIHILAKTYGWTREYILSLCENEIHQHLYEIRNDNIASLINKYLVNSGEKGIMSLDDRDPVKMTYIKQKKEIKEEENERDGEILQHFLSDLKEMGYKMPTKGDMN